MPHRALMEFPAQSIVCALPRSGYAPKPRVSELASATLGTYIISP